MTRHGLPFLARLGTFIALAAVLIAGVASTGADAARRPHRPVSFPFFDVPLPSKGHVTIGAYSVTFPKAVKRGLPAGLKLFVPEARKLPRSTRVVTMSTRLDSPTAVRFGLVVLAIRQRAPAKKAVAGAHAATKFADTNSLLGLYDPVQGERPLVFSLACSRCQKMIYFDEDPNPYGSAISDLCDDCEREGHIIENYAVGHEPRICPGCRKHTKAPVMKAEIVRNVDQANADQVKAASDSLQDLFGGRPSGDPNLETGHYDDGHAFGWNVKKDSDAERLMFKSLDEITKLHMDTLIAQIESEISADVDGDGAVGFSSPPQQIDTQVGTPVITGGGGGP